MEWDRRMAMTRQARYPELNFVRFVADNYYSAPDRSRVKFLDLGCGAGANSWYLAHEGFHVTALDKSTAALESLKLRFEEERFFRDRITFVQADIRAIDLGDRQFDCVLDHNSLCHVERPPLVTIHESLKRGGKLFMVAPSPDTWKETLWGKGYCRLPTEKKLRDMLKMFSDIKIGKASYPHRGHDIKSWIVEATL
jgi:2-polyprenyl-3-methyl-5-hydroxy-6-metoxy-1,4-benzoquinol methylase